MSKYNFNIDDYKAGDKVFVEINEGDFTTIVYRGEVTVKGTDDEGLFLTFLETTFGAHPRYDKIRKLTKLDRALK